MQTRFVLSAEELYGIVASAFEANGHKPTQLAFFAGGSEVTLERVEVAAEQATLKVRCAPETALSQAIQARYDHLVASILKGELGGDQPAKPAGGA